MGFWENPELLFGYPFLVLGVLGLLLSLGALVAYWIRPS